MSKPTENQRTLCSEIISNVRCWMNTNDISSPTHHSDLSESIYAGCEDFLDDADISCIEFHLIGLLSVIRRVE